MAPLKREGWRSDSSGNLLFRGEDVEHIAAIIQRLSRYRKIRDIHRDAAVEIMKYLNVSEKM